jgi:hypothetical protein
MDILEQLKDDHEYYNGVGKKYLSNSNIGQLLKHPALFQKDEGDNKNFLAGRYFHQLILEPEKAKDFPIIDVSSRTTKAYKEASADGSMLLLEKEAKEIKSWVNTIDSNKHFASLIYDPANRYEIPAVAELHGNLWKGKADIITKDYVIDLKTSSDSFKFKRNSFYYNYDSQAYIYQQLFGKPVKFLVIDKNHKVLSWWDVSPEALSNGEEKVKRATEIYNKYYSDDATEKINEFFVEDCI